ncbi:MAG: glycerate kinase [Planctomycetes bacterium]|nr:glycerate kinase [Planctomycetota bacterium]
MSAARRVLVACASFKGTLSSAQAGQALARGLRRAGFAADVVALADGGEGLVEALHRAVPGARMATARVRGPLLEKRSARFALLPPPRGSKRPTAVLEMAASSGLPLVPETKRDPNITSTWGVGDQIRAALDAGAGRILLGIGGSATNDGGAGMAQALGARLLDAAGRELPAGGAALLALDRIDLSGFDARLKRVPVTVACDVTNPLTGTRGASAVYGPQKGASPRDVALLDRALSRFAKIAARDLGRDVRRMRGAGAAGGLGAGCVAFLNAELKPGIELALDAIGFDQRLRGAGLALTGEGRLDRQTLMGKAPAGVARRAKAAGVACVAVGGAIEADARAALARRFVALESLIRFAGSREAALRDGARWLERLAEARAEAWWAAGGRR